MVHPVHKLLTFTNEVWYVQYIDTIFVMRYALHDLQIIPGPHIHAAGHAHYMPQQLLRVISVTGNALAMED